MGNRIFSDKSTEGKENAQPWLITTAFRDNRSLPSNEIHTSKYRWWSFIPKNLWEQFSKLQNIYFLVMGVFQILPYTTLTQGVPSVYLPLGIIILVTAVKDLYQDSKRATADQTDNDQQVVVMTQSGVEKTMRAAKVRAGMVLKVLKNEYIPVDGLVLNSSSATVYVDTANIDGETALKKKQVLTSVRRAFNGSSKLLPQVTVQYQQPNTQMNRFDGRLIHSEDKLPLNNANLLLRSSKLKNTEWVYLLALYTGHSSKIVMSMNRPRTKRSTIESKLGYLIGCTFCFMLVLSLVATVLKITANTKTVNLSFAFGDAELFFVSMISWILNLNNLVPISLIVTVEMVKLLETKLIGLDPAMSREDVSTRVNCSNILEDLGVIDCVASDKTGTLTKNKLTMRQLSDGLLTYNCSSRNVPERVLLMLSSAHEVSRSSSGDLEGTSQDEIAILEFCMLHDIELSDRTTEALTLKIGQRSVTRKILRCLEFTSERKRQSVLFEENGKVWLVVKGADEQMLSIMKPSDTRDNIYMDLFTFAKEGLRTLVYGCRSLPTDIAEQWCKDYQLAEFNKNHDRMKQLEDDLERDLNALCATAIEDELQDEVVQTVRSLIAAEIKFVIISGDKPETVMAIANNLKVGEEPFLAIGKEFLPEYTSKGLVVFARCTPKDKQRIVSSIPGRTLAIGDGANDVCMLTKANIGVGIHGKEGRAAAQAGDIAIPEFRFLKRLLFFYGCELQRKNAYVVRYNFYKNFVYALPQLVFGMVSGWTGTAVYETYLSQLFNLLYASLPIVLFALFDLDSEEEELLENHHATYQISRMGCHFSAASILITLTEAIAVAVVGSYTLFIVIPLTYTSPNDLDVVESSVLLMFWVVLVVNIVLLMHVRHTSANLLVNGVATIGLYIGSVKIVGLLSLEISMAFQPTMSLKGILVVLACTTLSMAVSLLFKAIQWKYLSKAAESTRTCFKYLTTNGLPMDDSNLPELRS